MRRHHVETELLHQPREAGRLAFGELEHEPGQSRGVDDRMLERALQPATHQPGVECVVTVLDQNGGMREVKEGPARITELRRADQHGPVDVVALAGIGVDRRAAVHQRVEEGKRAAEPKPLGPQLQDQERGVARRLDVDGHELCIHQPCLGTQPWGIDCDLVPCHQLRGTSRLEEERFGRHRTNARARRAKRISSAVIARSSSNATE